MNSLFQVNTAIQDLIFLHDISPTAYGVIEGLFLLFYALFFKQIVIKLEKNIIHFMAAAILTMTYFTGPLLSITFITFLKYLVYIVENPREYPRISTFLNKIF